jgi:hypothetical protein
MGSWKYKVTVGLEWIRNFGNEDKGIGTGPDISATATSLIKTTFWLVLVLFAPVSLSAQETDPEVSEQVWANLVLSFPRSEKLYLEYDIEAARQVSSGEPWRSFYGTGLVEYYPNSFIDLTGDLATGFTQQSEAEHSFEVTARVGFRLHLLTQIINNSWFKDHRPERMSGSRFSIANYARIELRNFNYSGERPSSHGVRFRDRIEFKVALNEPNLATDGVWYLMADGEWFVPMSSEEAPERFAQKFRVRAGIGYRRDYKWRFELVAMRDDARDTLDEEFEVEALMINFRAKWFF